jgi:Protein of unknown function (DUF2955)
MPIDGTVVTAGRKARALDDPRARRILRFTVGVTLATAYSSYINWPFSFMLVALVIPLLALPVPAAPSLRFGVWTVTKLLAFTGLGVVLMLPLHSYQLFGFAVVALILFITFYLQAEGKIAGLNAIFVIVGVTLVPAFGQNSIDTGIEFAKGFSQSALALFPVIWAAFAVLPGGVFPGLPNAPRVAGTPAHRGILALRPVVVLLPLFAYMLSSDNNIRYLIGYYQPAMIAQHASRATARKLAGDLFLATLIGATGGLIMWWLMKLWPSWPWFVLMMSLFSLLYATRIFGSGPGGLTPNYYRWSYGLSTLVFIVFPDALTQGFTGDDPNMKFYQRVLDYFLITSYSVFSVLVFDAVVDRLRILKRRFARGTA